VEALAEAARCREPVVGLTHNFYRYPARFSPQFARAAVATFTEPGDTVLDPFMGGGTSAVETLAADGS
jgi:tRNA G10  N-methylase Trm11